MNNLPKHVAVSWGRWSVTAYHSDSGIMVFDTSRGYFIPVHDGELSDADCVRVRTLPVWKA